MQFQFSAYGTKHPIEDSQLLTLGPGEVRADISLRIDTIDDDEMPTDIVAADIKISDKQGKGWQTTIRFTAELLLAPINNLIDATSPSPVPKEQLAALQPVISPRYSSDDRLYRYFPVDETLVTTQFRYTSVTFDIYEAAKAKSIGDYLVHVRNDGSLVDAEGSEIDEFVYPFDAEQLLSWNRACFDEEEETNMNSPVPFPLLFKPVEGNLSPQDTVLAR